MASPVGALKGVTRTVKAAENTGLFGTRFMSGAFKRARNTFTWAQAAIDVGSLASCWTGIGNVATAILTGVRAIGESMVDVMQFKNPLKTLGWGAVTAGICLIPFGKWVEKGGILIKDAVGISKAAKAAKAAVAVEEGVVAVKGVAGAAKAAGTAEKVIAAGSSGLTIAGAVQQTSTAAETESHYYRDMIEEARRSGRKVDFNMLPQYAASTR